MDLVKVLVASLAGALLTAQATPAQYAEGQVWEYRTRSGEEGSLLKIQRIEEDPTFAATGPVYHISVIGFHFSNPRLIPELPHAPVTRQTLDASVVRLSTSTAAFPDAAPGIAQWRAAGGGVYTISVAKIIESLDLMSARLGE